MKGYRQERGFLWPEDDVECARVVFDTTADAALAVSHCRGRRLVVQAGGNCGVWPVWFSHHFERVYTFEPDPKNFRALVVNTAECPNVLALPLALGQFTGPRVGLHREAGNAGAHRVDLDGQETHTLAVDDLMLPACDLIYLDIEGFEFQALAGATATIERYRPVIAVEDKGLSEHYRTSKGDIEKWLDQRFGYEVAARPNRDVILVPREEAQCVLG